MSVAGKVVLQVTLKNIQRYINDEKVTGSVVIMGSRRRSDAWPTQPSSARGGWHAGWGKSGECSLS